MMANIIILINILILTSGFVTAVSLSDNSKPKNVIQQDPTQEIAQLQLQISYLRKDVDILKQNPVPIGYIYTQLAMQSDPHSIWPGCEWNNISPQYAGLFFRTEGGRSSEFGQIQNEQARSLQITQSHCNISAKNCVEFGESKTVPATVTTRLFDRAFRTGDHNPEGQHGINFRYSADENIPRNQAMRIWVRVR